MRGSSWPGLASGLLIGVLALAGVVHADDERCARVVPVPRGVGESLAPAELAPDTEALAALGQGLAWLRRGDVERAARFWLFAVDAAAARGEAATEADARLWLAQAYRRLGLLGRALFELDAATRVAAPESPARRASILAARADVRRAMGERSAAEDLYAQAGAALAGFDHPALEAAVLNARGALLATEGRSEQALPLFRRAAERAAAAGDPGAALRARAHIVRLDVRAGGEPLAPAAQLGPLVALAGEVEALPPSSERVALDVHLGMTAAELDRVPVPGAGELAARWLERAAKLAAELGDARSVSFAEGHRGGLYERNGRRVEALELTRRAMFAAQAAGAPEALYLWQWQLARLRRAALDVPAALDAYRDAVRTLQALRSETPIGIGGVDESFDEAVRPVFFGLADVLLERARIEEDAERRRALLIEARNTMEELKTAELRDYFQDVCLAAKRVTAPDAIPGTAVLYPIVLPDRTELIVSTPAGFSALRIEIPEQELEALVTQTRELYEKRTTRQYRRPAARLYDLLIRPLEARFEAAGVNTLVFVPDGSLRTIPMAALWDRERREFLIERYPIAITPGLTLTDPRAIDRENVALLLAGLTQSVQGFPALPHVAREAAAVSESFAGASLIDEAFAESRLRGRLEAEQFGIVHIASHAEFHSESDASFLLTHDGRLQVDELQELIGLTRFREVPIELLTLSACETAAGDERAALGLAGVAVRAGARSALATLWPVNDQASSELVSEFYRQLALPGVSRAEALRRAQRSLIGVRRYNHPGYWAPFLMISSWL